ncbi:hypothetical protein J007_01805 [Cryptococcus neoformans]|nr:hypothetical protein J007_01805 [Cryptococcus neoformans var. grubii]OXC62846.1 hypothetical protein C358_01812 [Cryptococcus neoformans var. grubii MW-RSA852]
MSHSGSPTQLKVIRRVIRKKKMRMTGGIAGIWCPHGICLAYQVMPTSEGRDDFFSLLKCFFLVPPKVIVYDFACSLATYCMLRDPVYFAHIRFLVDELHAHGHTTCSRAGRSSTATFYSPNLRMVNSIVAEGNHSILRRLRKSLSYMNEEHFLCFFDMAIQAMNRRALLKHEWEVLYGGLP